MRNFSSQDAFGYSLQSSWYPYQRTAHWQPNSGFIYGQRPPSSLRSNSCFSICNLHPQLLCLRHNIYPLPRRNSVRYSEKMVSRSLKQWYIDGRCRRTPLQMSCYALRGGRRRPGYGQGRPCDQKALNDGFSCWSHSLSVMSPFMSAINS